MARKELTAKETKIEKIINKIEDGDVKIPAFQRGFVWDVDQVIDFLDSIYKDFPVGSILLWEAEKELRLKSTRNIAGIVLPTRKDNYPVNYVLDGQQRLSTLFAVFNHGHEDIDYEIESVGIPNHNIFDIYFDLEKKEFLHASNLPKYISHKKNQLSVFDVHKNYAFIKLSFLLDHESLLMSITELKPEQRKTVIELQKQFNNYEIPVVTISGRSKQEVGVIFERINNTGTPLTTLDLMIAWTWSDHFNLREEINNIIEDLKDKEFGDIPEKLILQCISSIVNEKISTEEILNLETVIIREKITKVKQALSSAIDFLSTHLNIISTDFLPNNLQIVPITYFYSKVKLPKPSQIKLLSRWFWKNSFADRYRYDTARRVHEDIQIIKEIISGDSPKIDYFKSPVTEQSFIQQPFSKTSAFTKAFLLLIASNSPLNLLTGEKIDIGKSLSKYNHKEYHHIFPKAFLRKIGKKKNEINCLANFCLLPARANKVISSTPPSKYILKLENDTLFSGQDSSYDTIFGNEKIMNSNFLPRIESIYQKDDYQSFLKERSKLLYQFYRNLIN